MKFFSTPNEKKSAIITSFIGAILILIFFVFGLTFFDPPISYGIEVNFSTLSDEKLTKKVISLSYWFARKFLPGLFWDQQYFFFELSVTFTYLFYDVTFTLHFD